MKRPRKGDCFRINQKHNDTSIEQVEKGDIVHFVQCTKSRCYCRDDNDLISVEFLDGTDDVGHIPIECINVRKPLKYKCFLCTENTFMCNFGKVLNHLIEFHMLKTIAGQDCVQCPLCHCKSNRVETIRDHFYDVHRKMDLIKFLDQRYCGQLIKYLLVEEHRRADCDNDLRLDLNRKNLAIDQLADKKKSDQEIIRKLKDENVNFYNSEQEIITKLKEENGNLIKSAQEIMRKLKDENANLKKSGQEIIDQLDDEKKSDKEIIDQFEEEKISDQEIIKNFKEENGNLKKSNQEIIRKLKNEMDNLNNFKKSDQEMITKLKKENDDKKSRTMKLSEY